jgi:uncharacterized protein YbjT (DUF2867 family)
MRNVLIVGARGSIATRVIRELAGDDMLHLTLFVRRASRLQNKPGTNCAVVEGDALNQDDMRRVMTGKDIVYVNLAGDLEAMTKNIVAAMKEKDVRRVIFISSIGIYETPLRSVLIPYRKGADVVESSGLDYTIIRPTWFTTVDEVDYELTKKGEPERGSVVSQKSLANFIAGIIRSPEKHVGENLGINKPNS